MVRKSFKFLHLLTSWAALKRQPPGVRFFGGVHCQRRWRREPEPGDACLGAAGGPGSPVVKRTCTFRSSTKIEAWGNKGRVQDLFVGLNGILMKGVHIIRYIYCLIIYIHSCARAWWMSIITCHVSYDVYGWWGHAVLSFMFKSPFFIDLHAAYMLLVHQKPQQAWLDLQP